MAVTETNLNAVTESFQNLPGVSVELKHQLASAFLQWINGVSINTSNYTGLKFGKAITLLGGRNNPSLVVECLRVSWVYLHQERPNEAARRWTQIALDYLDHVPVDQYAKLLADPRWEAFLQQLQGTEKFAQNFVETFGDWIRENERIGIKIFDLLNVCEKIVDKEFYSLCARKFDSIFQKLYKNAKSGENPGEAEESVYQLCVFLCMLRLIVCSGGVDEQLETAFKVIPGLGDWARFHFFLKAVGWVSTKCALKPEFFQKLALSAFNTHIGDEQQPVRMLSRQEMEYDGKILLEGVNKAYLNTSGEAKLAVVQLHQALKEEKIPTFDASDTLWQAQVESNFIIVALTEYLHTLLIEDGRRGADKLNDKEKKFLTCLSNELSLNEESISVWQNYMTDIYKKEKCVTPRLSRVIQWCSWLFTASFNKGESPESISLAANNAERHYYLLCMKDAPSIPKKIHLLENGFFGKKRFETAFCPHAATIEEFAIQLQAMQLDDKQLEKILQLVVDHVQVDADTVQSFYQQFKEHLEESFFMLAYVVTLRCLANGRTPPHVSQLRILIAQLAAELGKESLNRQYKILIESCIQRTQKVIDSSGLGLTLKDFSPSHMTVLLWSLAMAEADIIDPKKLTHFYTKVNKVIPTAEKSKGISHITLTPRDPEKQKRVYVEVENMLRRVALLNRINHCRRLKNAFTTYASHCRALFDRSLLMSTFRSELPQ